MIDALSTIASDALKKLSIFNSGDVIGQSAIKQLVSNSSQPNVLLQKLFIGANNGALCASLDDRALVEMCNHFKDLRKLVIGSAAISDSSMVALSQYAPR